MSTTSKFFIGSALAVSLFFSANSNAQIYVRVRPPRPHVVITPPPRPTPAHVWVEEDWRYNNGRYEHSGGYWAAPEHPGYHWHGGHWAHGRRGYGWIPGHWSRR